jgi:hypothetical protein
MIPCNSTGTGTPQAVIMGTFFKIMPLKTEVSVFITISLRKG